MSRRFLLYRHFDEGGGMPPEKRAPDNASPATPCGEGVGGSAEPDPEYREYAHALEAGRPGEPYPPLPDGDAHEEQPPDTQNRAFGPEQPQPASGISPVAPAPRPARRYSLAIISVLLAALIVFGAVAGIANLYGHLGTSNMQLGHHTAAFQPAHCPFKLGAGIVEGKQVNCGYVTVPENRNADNNHKVRLAVAIFKSKRFMASADPTPVVRLEGGPGGATLDGLASKITSTNYNARVFNHDLVMFDQRGIGHSTPSLDCKSGEGVQGCHDRLVRQGVDLNGFNTLQNAADVADLIRALGYPQMTVYGVSYGTRLALTVMRLHPEVVHAAVLDSVYPTTRTFSEVPSSAQRAFDTLFQGCAKDPGCNAKYPDLERTFYTLVNQWNAHPISFTVTDPATQKQQVIPFSGNDLVAIMRGLLYPTRALPALPQFIYQLHEHNYRTLSLLISASMAEGQLTESGMFLTTECSEDMPFMKPQDLAKAQQGLRPEISGAISGALQSWLNACRIWNVKAVPAEQKQPVISAIPTLVLSGEYDPITPPSYGQEAAQRLSLSYHFLFPGQGHGQEYSSPCSNLIISEFQDNPYQRPSDACMSQMTPPEFQ